MSLPLTSSAAAQTLFRWAAERQSSTSPTLVDHSLPPARVELSGRVFVNWWAKNVGLLESEWGIGPGSRISFDAPVHWRTLPLVFASLGLGATLGAGLDSPDLVVTTDPIAAQDAGAPEILAVSLEPLAVRFGGQLPSFALDHAAEVRAQPDRLIPTPALAAQAVLMHDDATVGLSALLAKAGGDEDSPSGTHQAVLWLPTQAGLAPAVSALASLAVGGALVLAGSDGLSDAVCTQERVTAAAPVSL